MSDRPNTEERGASPRGENGMFGAAPKPMAKPAASKPPTQGPEGAAGDSGALSK